MNKDDIHARVRAASAELKDAPQESIETNLVFALGFLIGSDLPYAAAALAMKLVEMNPESPARRFIE